MSELTFTRLRTGTPGDKHAPLLQLHSITVNVGIRRVIEGLDLSIAEGEAIRVTGPNGSGKSTLLNAIAGVAPARVTAGRIEFHGQDITARPAHERAALGLSFMRQRENVFPELTVEENLHIALGPSGFARFQESLPSLVASLPRMKRASLLSGGQRQRLAWAMTSLRPWRLLLADEPTAGLSEPLPLPSTGAYLVVSHSTHEGADDCLQEHP